MVKLALEVTQESEFLIFSRELGAYPNLRIKTTSGTSLYNEDIDSWYYEENASRIEQLGFGAYSGTAIIAILPEGNYTIESQEQNYENGILQLELYALGPASSVATLDGVQNLDLIGDNTQPFAIIEKGTNLMEADIIDFSFSIKEERPIGTFIGMADIGGLDLNSNNLFLLGETTTIHFSPWRQTVPSVPPPFSTTNRMRHPTLCISGQRMIPVMRK